jgi:hypothetical protein
MSVFSPNNVQFSEDMDLETLSCVKLRAIEPSPPSHGRRRDPRNPQACGPIYIRLFVRWERVVVVGLEYHSYQT